MGPFHFPRRMAGRTTSGKDTCWGSYVGLKHVVTGHLFPRRKVSGTSRSRRHRGVRGHLRGVLMPRRSFQPSSCRGRQARSKGVPDKVACLQVREHRG